MPFNETALCATEGLPPVARRFNIPRAPRAPEIPLVVHDLPRDTLLSAEAVSASTGIGRVTLANWRSNGQGPRFFKLGERMVRYKAGDIADFIDAGATTAAEGSAA